MSICVDLSNQQYVFMGPCLHCVVVTGSDVSSSSSKTLTVAGTNIPRFTALARGFSVTKQQPGLFTKMCIEMVSDKPRYYFMQKNTIVAGFLYSLL